MKEDLLGAVAFLGNCKNNNCSSNFITFWN